MQKNSEFTLHQVRGHKVLLRPSRHNEIAAMAIFSPYGGACDAAGKAGLGSLKQSVMEKGAGGKDFQELAEAIEELGSTVGGSTVRDYSKFSLAASSRCFSPTVDLLADLLHAPHFEAEELEKERKLQIAEVKQSDDNQFSYTTRHLIRALYGSHPYGVSSEGTPETLAAIELPDVLNTHAAHLRTRGGVVAAVGNFDADNLLARLETLLPEPALSLPTDPRREGRAGRDATERDVQLTRSCEQAFLCMGWLTVPMSHPDYAPLRLLTAILGEGMGSRMFVALRDELGLAYSTGAYLNGNRDMSHLVMYIGTKPDRLGESRAGFDRLVVEMRGTPPEASQLDRARNYVLGHFLFDHQKNGRQAHYLGSWEMLGFTADEDQRWPERLAAVTGEQVLDVAQRYLTEPTVAQLVPTVTTVTAA